MTETINAATAILDREIMRWVKRGARIQNRTDRQAQLVMPAKGKSLLLVIVLLVLGVVPGVIYLIWPRKDTVITLTLDASGKLHTLKRKA